MSTQFEKWIYDRGMINSETGKGIAVVMAQVEDIAPDEVGKLIAAAPELLEALQEMVDYWDFMIKDHDFPAYRKAKQAIAKSLNQ